MCYPPLTCPPSAVVLFIVALQDLSAGEFIIALTKYVFSPALGIQ